MNTSENQGDTLVYDGEPVDELIKQLLSDKDRHTLEKVKNDKYVKDAEKQIINYKEDLAIMWKGIVEGKGIDWETYNDELISLGQAYIDAMVLKQHCDEEIKIASKMPRGLFYTNAGETQLPIAPITLRDAQTVLIIKLLKRLDDIVKLSRGGGGMGNKNAGKKPGDPANFKDICIKNG